MASYCYTVGNTSTTSTIISSSGATGVADDERVTRGAMIDSIAYLMHSPARIEEHRDNGKVIKMMY